MVFIARDIIFIVRDIICFQIPDNMADIIKLIMIKRFFEIDDINLKNRKANVIRCKYVS